MIDFENAWRAIILTWSLASAAGLSLTFIMFRAALADQQQIKTLGRNGELALLARRVLRGVGSRLLALIALLLSSGTLWVVPEPAAQLSDLVVRMGFAVVFALLSIVLCVVSIRDLMDTLKLMDLKPLSPRTGPTPDLIP